MNHGCMDNSLIWIMVVWSIVSWKRYAMSTTNHGRPGGFFTIVLHWEQRSVWNIDIHQCCWISLRHRLNRYIRAIVDDKNYCRDAYCSWAFRHFRAGLPPLGAKGTQYFEGPHWGGPHWRRNNFSLGKSTAVWPIKIPDNFSRVLYKISCFLRAP